MSGAPARRTRPGRGTPTSCPTAQPWRAAGRRSTRSTRTSGRASARADRRRAAPRRPRRSPSWPREHGTPLFVLDEARPPRPRPRDFAGAFAGADVYYAGKAFLCGQVARWIAEEGLGLDVCTGGELAVALAAGFPAERIALHGNNKSVAELRRAVDAGVGHVVVDSFDEIDRLRRWPPPGRAGGTPVPVLVRVTVGVEAHTHEFIATAHEDQKFGFSLATRRRADRRRPGAPASRRCELVGLHSHIGSQIFDTAGFEVAAHRVVGLLGAVRDEATGEVLAELNLGGGLGIAYLSEDDPATPTRRRRAAARDRRRGVRRSSGCRCRGWPSSPAGRSSGPARSRSTRSARSSRRLGERRRARRWCAPTSPSTAG